MIEEQKEKSPLPPLERGSSKASLQIYIDELLKWNRGMNLIGKSTEKEVWETHIEDSLRLLPFLEKNICNNVIDIGSGGGLPAIPLSICMPQKKFFVTEVDSKKLAFLEFITKKLILNASVIDINKGFLFKEESVIISRAFSSIKNILEWARLHTENNSGFYLLKGREERVEEELEEAFIERSKIVRLQKGCVVIIEGNI